MRRKRGIIRSKKLKYIIIVLTFIAIVTTAILTKQPFLTMLPLCISLIVMALSAEASRMSFLIGGLNSILYAVVYWTLGLYGIAAQAMLVSFPFQIVTFFLWKRRAYKHSVTFKRLSTKGWLLVGGLFAAASAGVIIVLLAKNSPYAILDGITSLLGTLATLLTMLAYSEYTYVNLLNGAISIALNAQLAFNDPSQSTHFIYAIYAFYCIVLGFFNVRKLYREQQTEGGTAV